MKRFIALSALVTSPIAAEEIVVVAPGGGIDADEAAQVAGDAITALPRPDLAAAGVSLRACTAPHLPGTRPRRCTSPSSACGGGDRHTPR